jgi:peroxin-5
VEQLAGAPTPLHIHPFPPQPNVDDLTRTFEQAFIQSQQTQQHEHHRSGYAIVPAAHDHVRPPSVNNHLFASLHNFLHSPNMPSPLLASQATTQTVGAHLSLHDKVRLRDRSTILARHLFSDQGDAFADAQANTLLAGLGIAAHEVPARLAIVGDSDAWQQVWQQQQQQQPPAEAGVAHQQWHLRHGSAGGHAAGGVGRAWVDEFSAPVETWARQFAGAHPSAGDTWAHEFAQAPETALLPAAEAADTVLQSARLAAVLESDPHGKFKDSQFLRFLSKMSQGQTDIAKPRGAAGWAAEFASGGGATALLHTPQETVSRPDLWAQQFELGQGAEEAALASSSADAWAHDYVQLQARGDYSLSMST